MKNEITLKIMPDTKDCVHCKVNKSFSEFYKCKNSAGGIKNTCKSCQKEHNKKYRNRPEIKIKRNHHTKIYRALPKNKERARIKHRERAATQKHKKMRADSYLRNKYKISLEVYDSLLIFQNGCCAICGIHESKEGRRFAVDHCHKTDIVRGLLCTNCNLGIGHFFDSIYILKKAIEYLEPTENFNKEILK